MRHPHLCDLLPEPFFPPDRDRPSPIGLEFADWWSKQSELMAMIETGRVTKIEIAGFADHAWRVHEYQWHLEHLWHLKNSAGPRLSEVAVRRLRKNFATKDGRGRFPKRADYWLALCIELALKRALGNRRGGPWANNDSNKRNGGLRSRIFRKIIELYDPGRIENPGPVGLGDPKNPTRRRDLPRREVFTKAYQEADRSRFFK